jgi:hypothetical protein
MLDLDKHVKDRAEEKVVQTRLWADIDNACYDHACELETYLRKYVAEKSLPIDIARAFNVVTLTNPRRHRLIISTQDHRRHELSRPDVKDARDEIRKISLTRLPEDQMMDELVEWLEVRPV